MFQFIIYFVLSVISALVLWWLNFTSTRFYKLCAKIPGPTPMPVIGNIELIINRKMFAEKILEIFQRHSSICRVFLGNACIVGLLDADDIFKMLNSNSTLSKFSFYIPIKLILGLNLLTAPRDDWRRYRKILNPGFNTKVIRTYINTMNIKCKSLIKILKDRESDSKFDMYDILIMLTMDTITVSSTGIDFEVQERNIIKLITSFKKIKEIIQECMFSPLHWFEIVYKHSKLHEEAIEYLKVDRQFLEPVKKKYIPTEIQNKERRLINDKYQYSIFDHVFRQMNSSSNNINKEKFIQEELLDQVRMIGIAGSETTAFTISVCLMLLGLHQDVQDKVVEELHDIFGNDICRPAEYKDLHRMTYTEQVIKETMRLFPVAFITGRKVDEEIEVGGYVLPVGTDIIISPFLLHRDPKYFPDPLKFDPERFTPENIRSRNPHCFIPFLTGPRNCIGHYYAMLQMKTILCHLLRHFEFLPCGSREEMEEVHMKMLLSLKHGYNVRIRVK